MGNHKLATLLIWISALSIILVPVRAVGQKNDPAPWSPVERIPGYDQSTWTPLLIADQNQTVHVFASDLLNGSDDLKAIVYRKWTKKDGWGASVDVLLSPIKNEARIHGAKIDKNGVMHLTFMGGDEVEANIYYARVLARFADKAPEWSQPEIIGPFASSIDDGTLAIDGKGNLYTAYAGTAEGSGVYVVNSTDGGTTWSDPFPLYLAYDAAGFATYMASYTDSSGNIHLVWAMNNESGLTESIYYAKLNVDSSIWTIPVEIENLGGIPGGMPAITEYNSELFLIYHTDSAGGVTRNMRRSTDGGKTWSDKRRLFPHVGSNGAVTFVTDGNNTLHVFFGNRVTIDGQITQGLWHSVWRNEQWTYPTAISSGIKRDDYDPSDPNAIVSQGNTILVTWMTDPGAIRKGVGGTWSSFLTIDAPQLPIIALPDVSLEPTPNPTIMTAEIVPTATQKPEIFSPILAKKSEQAPRSTGSLLILSLLPVLLLLSAVAYVQLRKRPRRS